MVMEILSEFLEVDSDFYDDSDYEHGGMIGETYQEFLKHDCIGGRDVE